LNSAAGADPRKRCRTWSCGCGQDLLLRVSS
jgi:hypothetical protein